MCPPLLVQCLPCPSSGWETSLQHTSESKSETKNKSETTHCHQIASIEFVYNGRAYNGNDLLSTWSAEHGVEPLVKRVFTALQSFADDCFTGASMLLDRIPVGRDRLHTWLPSPHLRDLAAYRDFINKRDSASAAKLDLAMQGDTSTNRLGFVRHGVRQFFLQSAPCSITLEGSCSLDRRSHD